jgi:serine/threonine protein kinase
MPPPQRARAADPTISDPRMRAAAAGPRPAAAAGTGAQPAVAASAGARPAVAAGTGPRAAVSTTNPALARTATPVSGVSSTPYASPASSADYDDGPAALPNAGTRIGKYELIRELGRGGMGAVYLARDTQLGRRVAIKFLQNVQKELRDRFQVEAQATASMSHENIVTIYDYGEHAGNPFMVLEFLQGSPLSSLLGEGQRLPPGRTVEIMAKVATALVAAHQHQIVHRDLKPDNIFLTDAGGIKVLDFGIAKLVSQPQGTGLGVPSMAARLAASQQDDERTGPTGNTELTRAGALIGTIPYMSPEQWMGVGVDHRTDIWAVGILMFKMVAGRHPLAPLRGQQLMVTAMLDQPMPSVRDAVPDLPDGLARIIDRCLRKRKEERFGSAQELLEALEPLMPGRFARNLRVDESPYTGLSAFQESDAARFFGRTREIAAMVTRLRDQPLVGVVGPSGVGKSSFVRAGVVPALKHSGEPWETVVIRPGRNPMAALATVAASLVSSTNSNSGAGTNTGVSSTTLAEEINEQQTYLKRLQHEPGFLGTLLRSRARRRQQRVLLFIDQFEELYTLTPDPAERLAFTACLSGVADDATTPLRVVLSIRSDFLDRVAEDQRFMAELSQGLFFLMPPGRDALREAIVMPAEMAGHRFETENMVRHMIDTLANTSGALPLLQFTATKLWEARDRGQKLLTEESYRAIGGTEGALASHADAVLNELPPQDQNLVRAIFLRLVTPERTRAIVSVAELRDLAQDVNEVQRIIEQLVFARLLVVQTGDAQGGGSVEIVHESLLHTWPRLRIWLDENQDDAAFLDQLRTAARQWHAKGRPGGLVWRGEAAEEARRFVRRYRGTLSKLEQDYLAAVMRLGARSTRIRRAAVAVAMLGLTVVAAGSTAAMVRISRAEKNATAQAAAAVAAEAKVREQYGELQDSMEKQKAAEQQARAALGEAQAANEEVMKSQERLAEANEGLVDALEKANRAKRKARRERQRAEENQEMAQQAALEARMASDQLRDALERERERLKRLESQLGSTLVEDLK